MWARYRDRLAYGLVGPLGVIEEGVGLSAQARPVDTLQVVEAGQAEVKRPSVECHGCTCMVDLPKASAVAPRLAGGQQLLV